MIAYMIYIANPGWPTYLHIIDYDYDEVTAYV